MGNGNTVIWEIMAWLGSLFVIVLIDAVRQSQPVRTPYERLGAITGQNVVFDEDVEALHQLFDKSQDDSLFPELRVPAAWPTGARSLEELLRRSA